jgi:hypothetical protein
VVVAGAYSIGVGSQWRAAQREGPVGAAALWRGGSGAVWRGRPAGRAGGAVAGRGGYRTRSRIVSSMWASRASISAVKSLAMSVMT